MGATAADDPPPAAAAAAAAAAEVEAEGAPPRSRYLSEAEMRAMPEEPRRRQRQRNSEAAGKRPWEPGYDKDRHTDPELPGWRVTEAMANAARGSAWLRGELTDPGLRRLVARVVVAVASEASCCGRGGAAAATEATAQERVLGELRSSHPRFRLFLDKLLVTAGVLERRGVDATVDLDEWLRRDHDCADELHLQLRPAGQSSKRRRVASFSTDGSSDNDEDEHDHSSSSDGDDDDDDSSDDDSSSASEDPR